MPKFEVHIPAADADPKGYSFTFRVDADGWTAALKAGMSRLGQQGAQGQNMLVDVQDDNSLHVTDAQSGRVFQIRELSDLEAATAVVKRQLPAPASEGFSTRAETIIQLRDTLSAGVRQEPGRVDQEEEEDTDPGLSAASTEEEMPAVGPPPRTMEPVTVLQRRITPRAAVPAAPDPDFSSISASAFAPTTRRPLPDPAPAGEMRREPTTHRGATPRGSRDLEVLELEKPVRPVTRAIGRSKTTRKDEIESLLSEVFERVQEVFGIVDPTEALYFLLDLALEKIPSDAGSVLEADEATGDLRFSAARGPKAAELLEANLIVPSGSGIAGFCAHEGVSVALSDVQKDPRHYAAVSRRVDYETRSVLTSPMMTHGRTYGCLQLLNKKGSPVFAAHEVGLLSYLAHQAALYLRAL